MRGQAEEKQQAKTEKKSKETLWHTVAQWFKRLTVTEGRAGDMPKYHPGHAILLLILIGLGSLLLGIAIGVILAIVCGVVFDLLEIPDSYYSDFLGGAVGLTVGFALDKLCIERINQITKYNNLIKIIKQELEFIQDNKFYADKTKCLSMSDYEEKVNDKEKDVLIKVKTSDGKELELLESDLKEDLIKNEAWKTLQKYEPTNHTVEFIFDDIVRNAETMSVLANLPLAYEYSKELIIEFECIQNYLDRLESCLDRFEYYLDRIARKEGDKDENLKLKDENLKKAQIRWILI